MKHRYLCSLGNYNLIRRQSLQFKYVHCKTLGRGWGGSIKKKISFFMRFLIVFYFVLCAFKNKTAVVLRIQFYTLLLPLNLLTMRTQKGKLEFPLTNLQHI